MREYPQETGTRELRKVKGSPDGHGEHGSGALLPDR